MAAKWVERIKAKLAENPLYFTGVPGAPCICKRCGGGPSHKVPLYRVTNYGNEFNHCYTCGWRPEP